ncbi:hypothetical protein SEMRO_1330_G263470.1 [Seminavis robusta]|uniref:Uncharacterized protein n=1 Tax=Seminavis robusta TaxID=568900 RepID=A0A9N8ENQ9_9STRA|nr:hypothetical protein SEMRO_1330_G263470.1 [Seminavis robusta]|eukprot:Sro1330_g263470.1 n/a (178) ;mRNA; f:27309-27842
MLQETAAKPKSSAHKSTVNKPTSHHRPTMNSWQVVAAVTASDDQKDATAESVATVQVMVDGCEKCTQYCGPVTLQRFGNTLLFRVVILNDKTNRNMMVINLPPDDEWRVELPKKLISPNTRTKAVKTIVRLRSGNAEGYDMMTITMPWNGKKGSSMVFAEAVIFASGVVNDACIDRT